MQRELKQKDDHMMIIQEEEVVPVLQIPSPGFRFFPTEEELVSFYLNNKLEDKRLRELNKVIPVVDIYALEPWQLPKLAGELCTMDTEQWFFFVPRQEREARGGRPSRTTTSGYWKATGSPSYVYSSDSRVIGLKKSLVFYKGKAPTGRKTKWKMNEYRAIQQKELMPCSSTTTHVIPKLRHEVSLCRVYVVSGSIRAFDRRPPLVGLMESTTSSSSSRERLMVTNAASHHDNCCCCQSGTILTMDDRRNSVECAALPKLDGGGVLFDNVDGDGRNWEEMDRGMINLMQWDEFSHPTYAAPMN